MAYPSDIGSSGQTPGTGGIDPASEKLPFIIDTAGLLDDLHDTFADIPQDASMDEQSKRRLVDSAKSAWNALVPYLQDRRHPVQRQHYEAIQQFRALLAQTRSGQTH